MFKGYNENRDVEINPKMNLFQLKNEFSFTSEKVSASYCPPHTVCN